MRDRIRVNGVLYEAVDTREDNSDDKRFDDVAEYIGNQSKLSGARFSVHGQQFFLRWGDVFLQGFKSKTDGGYYLALAWAPRREAEAVYLSPKFGSVNELQRVCVRVLNRIDNQNLRTGNWTKNRFETLVKRAKLDTTFKFTPASSSTYRRMQKNYNNTRKLSKSGFRL